MLAKDNLKVYTYGLENAEELEKIKNVQITTLEEAIKPVEFVVSGIPFTSNGVYVNSPFSKKKITVNEVIKQANGKCFIAGGIDQKIRDKSNQENVKIIDILKREEFTILNTISTAEGAIQIAMEETSRTLHGSKILILGFGRIGKILAKMLSGIGAKVYCEARKNEDFAWIKAYGYELIQLNKIKNSLHQFDVIINTIPSLILTKEYLKKINMECIIIDVASLPGGVDKEFAKQIGIRVISALSLPGKVAPVTSAEIIKETIYNILEEMKN